LLISADFGHRRRRRGLDRLDELVDVGERDGEAFEHVAALACLAQLEHGAPRHHLAPVLEEDRDQVLQVAELRLAVDQRDHVDAEGVLQLRLLVEVVEDDLGHLAALELDDDAHAGLVALVLDVADALELLLVNQLGHPLEQVLLVHLVGNLVDDDRLALTLVDVLEVALRAHDDAAATGAIALANAAEAVDDSGGGKSGAGMISISSSIVASGRRSRCTHASTTSLRLCGGMFGRHAHRDAARAVDEQVRQLRRHDERLLLAAVVVRAEVHRLLVEIGEHLVRDLGEADLGVAHRRRVVAVDRAEVALAVDEHVAHREVLRHAHDRVVDRLVAVRVVLADDVADDARRLLVRAGSSRC
jgi:hypothetical protein